MNIVRIIYLNKRGELKMVSYEETIKIAKKQILNIKNENELAHSYKWAYYFACSLINPKKNIKSLKFNKASKPQGHEFKKSIPTNFIVNWSKQLIQYVQTKKKMPSYMVYRNIHIAPPIYCYLLAYCVVYQSKTGVLPNSVTVDTAWFKSKKKYGHATKHGCDNMGQNNGYYCGCHGIQEVIRNLTGIVVPQSTIASWAGTTEDGTCHEGLNTAIWAFNKKYGYNLSVEWFNFSDLGWEGILKILNSKNKDIIFHLLYRLKYGHYEVINKVLTSNLYVQNSLGNSCDDDCFCGYVEDRSKAEHRSYINGISQKSVMVITNK